MAGEQYCYAVPGTEGPGHTRMLLSLFCAFLERAELTLQHSWTAILRNANCKHELISGTPEVKTVYHAFQNAARNFPNKACSDTAALMTHRFLSGHAVPPAIQDCYGTRQRDPRSGQWLGYKWKTYREVSELVTAFGAGLVAIAQQHLGLGIGTKWHLGLYSVNREEWAIAQYAGYSYNLTDVALCKSFVHWHHPSPPCQAHSLLPR